MRQNRCGHRKQCHARLRRATSNIGHAFVSGVVLLQCEGQQSRGPRAHRRENKPVHNFRMSELVSLHLDRNLPGQGVCACRAQRPEARPRAQSTQSARNPILVGIQGTCVRRHHRCKTHCAAPIPQRASHATVYDTRTTTITSASAMSCNHRRGPPSVNAVNVSTSSVGPVRRHPDVALLFMWSRPCSTATFDRLHQTFGDKGDTRPSATPRMSTPRPPAGARAAASAGLNAPAKAAM